MIELLSTLPVPALGAALSLGLGTGFLVGLLFGLILAFLFDPRRVLTALWHRVHRPPSSSTEDLQKNAAEPPKVPLPAESLLAGVVQVELPLLFKKWQALEQELRELKALSPSLQEIAQTLRNHQTRGLWGERQLESILTQLLPPHAYRFQSAIPPESAENVLSPQTTLEERASQRVDALVRIGKLWLPIDSKFPRDRLNELIAEGQDLGPTHRKARLALAESLRSSAREIKKKYIQPHLGTTDFGLLFLPAEALYLEAMKHPQLSLLLEQERIYLCSPQTLSGFLQLLQMVEQRSELAANAEAMMLEMKRARRLLDLLNDRLEETSKHLRKAGESNQSALTHFYRLSERLERPSPPTAETSPEARTKGTSSDLPL